MIDVSELRSAFVGKRVFLTGHTGFKGAWMLQVLHRLGAVVKGYALPPEHGNDLYEAIQGDQYCYSSVLADVRNYEALRGELIRYQPHFVFHLAAQALVRRSYAAPLETFAANALGTAHILEALRGLDQPCTTLIITTDKVYENNEEGAPFLEDGPLGGYDPYSASKAAAEVITQSYRRSFFNLDHFSSHQKSVASLRAGNVIGGGDRSEDRLIPDLVRALEEGHAPVLRNPNSVRPWQHVLEPVYAYLMMGAALSKAPALGTAYNIGPEAEDARTVSQVADAFCQAYGRPPAYEIRPDTARHEANLLLLDNSKIKQALGWKPLLNADEAIAWTAAWYADQAPAADKCTAQMLQYEERF